MWWVLLVSGSVAIAGAIVWTPQRNTGALIDAVARNYGRLIATQLGPALCPYCGLPVTEPDPGWPTPWCPPDANGAPMHVPGPWGWA